MSVFATFHSVVVTLHEDCSLICLPLRIDHCKKARLGNKIKGATSFVDGDVTLLWRVACGMIVWLDIPDADISEIRISADTPPQEARCR